MSLPSTTAALLFILCLCKGDLHAQPETGAIVTKKITASFSRRSPGDSCFTCLSDSLQNAIRKNDQLSSATYLKQMALICFQLHHYPQALDYLANVDDIYKKQHQSSLRAENLADIGKVYLANHQPDLAKQQYRQAFNIYQSLRSEDGKALIESKIGQLYFSQHKHDSALFYKWKALAAFVQTKNSLQAGRVCGDVGTIYEDEKKYDSAYYYFNQSLLISRVEKDTLSIIVALNNTGDIFRKTGHAREAIALSKEALALAIMVNDPYHMGNTYQDLAKAYHLLKSNDTAYYYQRKAHRYLADTNAKESNGQLEVLKTIYDLEKKENARQRSRAITRATWSSVIISLLLLAVAVLVLSRQRLRMKNEQLLSDKKLHQYEADKKLMELQEKALKQELELKSKELGTHTLHIMQKNKFFEKIHQQLDEMVKDDKRDQRKPIKQLQLQISQHINYGQQWDEFHGIFDQVHHDFFQKLQERCDTLTRSDLRVVALLKMNLNSVEMATLLNISQDSLRVMRYRIRRKLNLQQGESLTAFIHSL